MSNNAEMDTNVITTSSTGEVTTMLSFHRKSQGTTTDSLLTVSGGLSKTGALVTPDLVDSSGRDEAVISSSRDKVVISSGRDMVVISSGEDMVVISSGEDVVAISSREVASSSVRNKETSSGLVISSNRITVIISGMDNRAKGRAAGEAPGTSQPPGADTSTTAFRADSVR